MKITMASTGVDISLVDEGIGHKLVCMSETLENAFQALEKAISSPKARWVELTYGEWHEKMQAIERKKD